MGVWRNGQAKIIPDAEGNRLWPSVVAFTDRGRRFWAAAQPTADSAGNPSGTLLGAKRFLARQMNDPGLQQDASLLAVSVHGSDADGHVTLSGAVPLPSSPSLPSASPPALPVLSQRPMRAALEACRRSKYAPCSSRG